MAYNYFPTSYQPAYPQYQQNTQQSMTWVQGEAGAKSYMVAPNQTVVLWDSEAETIYLKSADATGMPSIKVLDYSIRDNAPHKPEIQPQKDFATKDEVAYLKKEIDALKAKFGDRKEAKK